MTCSGRRSCKIAGSNLVHHNIRPCPVELMTYLLAGYQCLEGKNRKRNASFAYIICSVKITCILRGRLADLKKEALRKLGYTIKKMDFF